MLKAGLRTTTGDTRTDGQQCCRLTQRSLRLTNASNGFSEQVFIVVKTEQVFIVVKTEQGNSRRY